MLAIKRDPYGCAIPWISQKADVYVCSLNFFPLFSLLFPSSLSVLSLTFTAVTPAWWKEQGRSCKAQSFWCGRSEYRTIAPQINLGGEQREAGGANPKINHVWVLFSCVIVEESSQQGRNNTAFWGLPLSLPSPASWAMVIPIGCTGSPPGTVPSLSVLLSSSLEEPLGGAKGSWCQQELSTLAQTSV